MTARKPRIVREREGNRGKRPLPSSEPQGRGHPRCPDYFEQEERQLWAALMKTTPPGLLCGADQAVCEVFVVHWQDFREASRMLTASGLLVKGERGPVKNPLITIRRMAAEAMDRAGLQLGLSPYARTRLSAEEEADTDPLGQLMQIWDAQAAERDRQH